jgi:hypothetical protein
MYKGERIYLIKNHIYGSTRKQFLNKKTFDEIVRVFSSLIKVLGSISDRIFNLRQKKIEVKNIHYTKKKITKI